MANPWFRLYHEMLDDRKIKRVCLKTKMPKYAIVGLWTGILALANQSPERGKLLISDGVPFEYDEIAMELDIDPDELRPIWYEMMNVGLFYFDECVNGDCYVIAKWDGRQFKSDDSNERVKKHRKKMQNSQGNERNVSVTPSDTDTEADTDTDTEDIKDTSVSLSKCDECKARLTKTETGICDYCALRFEWANHFPDKPQPRAKTKSLRSKARARMKNSDFRENHKAALARGEKSSFLNSGGWFTFDWFVKNDENWFKCFNGNYDDKPVNQAANRSGNGTATNALAEYERMRSEALS